MMDYSVGNVADLISGSLTPNKPKVLKKQFKMKPKISQENEQEDTLQHKREIKKLKRKRSISPKNQQVEQFDDLNRFSIMNQTEVEYSLKEKPRKKIKQKGTKSPKGIPFAPIDDTDKVEKDHDIDNQQSNDDSGKKKFRKHVKDITPINPEHTTIFVGNLPISTTHKNLEKLFSKIGNVVNARIRSIPIADPKIPKKVAAIKKQFHPERKSVHGYVTFATHEDAQKALSLNGQEYKGHHIRVNICDETQVPDKTKAIFLGNVSFAAEEEELWKLFQSCGEIESVRLVRDRFTDIGKGFGYINFKSADAVELALQMGEVKLRDRILRISLYNGKAPKKAKIQKSHSLKHKKSNLGNRSNKLVTTATVGQFQGKFATERKKKFNKGNQQKKKLAKKIAPKTIMGN